MARGGDQKRIAGAVFGVIGIILVAVALGIDEISGFYAKKSSDDSLATCGWQKLTASSDFGSSSAKYSTYCDYDDDACDAETAGQCWFVFCILAIVGGVVGLGVEFLKRTKFTELSYFAAMLFCILALISFFAKNGYCWDSDSIYDERLAASSIIMIINCLVFLIAGVCSHDKSGYIKI